MLLLQGTKAGLLGNQISSYKQNWLMHFLLVAKGLDDCSMPAFKAHHLL